MKNRLFLCLVFFFYASISRAKTTWVKNIDELKQANRTVQPGDVVILKNGNWKDVIIELTCSGKENQPILFKAETPGMVVISGRSQLRIGGNYIIVDGLLFENGFAGDDAVIDFRSDKDHVANRCRVTNTVINAFNNPQRMMENYWVQLAGKNNRIDHCSFIDKKNLGVLMAVILDDERSRENFHSIDHNYFGKRTPLGSNGGEIIRIGVSQHCQFNSNTLVSENFFEHCDGETEIVSVKSCENVVVKNLFKECQGAVVLRHGNYNTVSDNIFLGNDKFGSGGVRVINKGQWVVNNLFYKCRGVDFRSPLAIMNGVPNSPANRYVQVTDAVIMNNTFYECEPVRFCEGSDSERSKPPANVLFAKNIFLNTRDSNIYTIADDISGFNFLGNRINPSFNNPVMKGFQPASFHYKKLGEVLIPLVNEDPSPSRWLDSLSNIARAYKPLLHSSPGFNDIGLVKELVKNTENDCGAKWYKPASPAAKTITINCKTAADIYQAIAKKQPVSIRLTGEEYFFDHPVAISSLVEFTGNKKKMKIASAPGLFSLFLIRGNGNLKLSNINFETGNVNAVNFIATDTTGFSDHYNISILNSSFSKIAVKNFLYTSKSTYADSIVARNINIKDCIANVFMMNSENDNKGLYAAEKILITGSQFDIEQGQLLNIYRGGNDESTLGPSLTLVNNKASAINEMERPLIELTGVQQSKISSNVFSVSPGNPVIVYKDVVRARHSLTKNILTGRVEVDQYVTAKQNAIKE